MLQHLTKQREYPGIEEEKALLSKTEASFEKRKAEENAAIVAE